MCWLGRVGKGSLDNGQHVHTLQLYKSYINDLNFFFILNSPTFFHYPNLGPTHRSLSPIAPFLLCVYLSTLDDIFLKNTHQPVQLSRFRVWFQGQTQLVQVSNFTRILTTITTQEKKLMCQKFPYHPHRKKPLVSQLRGKKPQDYDLRNKGLLAKMKQESNQAHWKMKCGAIATTFISQQPLNDDNNTCY